MLLKLNFSLPVATDQSVLCVHNYMYTITTPVMFDLSDQSEVFVHNTYYYW